MYFKNQHYVINFQVNKRLGYTISKPIYGTYLDLYWIINLVLESLFSKKEIKYSPTFVPRNPSI